MATLSIKLNVLPGITKDIDLTLEDLLTSFNSAWDLEDRIELAMNLDLEAATEKHKLKPIATILNNLDITTLTVGQLLTLETVLKDTIKNIIKVKEDIIKESEE